MSSEKEQIFIRRMFDSYDANSNGVLEKDEFCKVLKAMIKELAGEQSEEELDNNVLTFGSELHYYLEHMDLNSDDLSYIKNRQMRKYVYNVKNSSLFKGVTNSMVRHEYHFYDEDSKIEGYIDALIIKEDEIDIIDFKTKNIDDSEYDRQLRIYKSYISKITSKPIKMYLLAAVTGEIREVKE